MSSRALVLINPGARRAGEGREAIVGRLKVLGIHLVLEVAPVPEEVADRVRRHRQEVDAVIVGGGDGTLNLALQGLVETGLPLGIIPLGTANNLARTIGIPADPLEACGVIAQGQRRRIDLGWVNGRYFFTTASIGLSVRITEELSAERRRRWGPPAIDDERLDLYSLEVRHWWQLLALAPAIKRGRQGGKSRVESLRATEFEIHTRTPRGIDVDGEIGGTTPARCRLLPRALEVFAPLPRMA